MSTKNIKYQFLHAINQNFKENQDKHSLKHEHLTGKATIFSYASRTDLIDVSANFSNWLKNTHPEIKQVKQISTINISEFLASKVDSCSQKTLEHYKAIFHKLSCVVNSTYQCNVDFTNDLIVPMSNKNGGGKIRCQSLESNDYLNMLNTTNLNLKKALLLSQNFGLRSCEISKLKVSDISSNQIQIIDSKGKRSRIIPIHNEEQKQALSFIISKTNHERICPIQHESLQQAFRRELYKTGIDSKYKNGSFHLCRKSFATNQYIKFRFSGYSAKESIQKVSILLGHGKNRFALMKEYICCPIT